MAWRDELLDRLAAAMPCGYHGGAAPATEPVALAAIALSTYGRPEESRQALQWLASIQNDDGSLGPTEAIESPGWPTALAVLAHSYAGGEDRNDVLGFCSDAGLAAERPGVRSDDERGSESASGDLAKEDFHKRAVEWLLTAKGEIHARKSIMGHDSTLVGWPWVLGTHSWVEPTALTVLALKAAGEGNHPRTREAVRLLRDRLLPDGGCNYGNTTVLGQTLRPHIQPTALALLALFGEKENDERILRSVEWLHSAIDQQTAVASMAYGIWALSRFGQTVPHLDSCLAAVAHRSSTIGSPHRMALVLLAGVALEVCHGCVSRVN